MFRPSNFSGLRLVAVVLFITAFLFKTSTVHAHGDDQLLIDALTEELAKAPEADLFIRRGELFRHHEEWTKAEADFVAAAKLEPKLALVDFFRARLWLEAGNPAKAQVFIDRYIATTPNEAEAWFLRGDVFAALGRHEAGAAEYAEGILRTPSPRPEHFMRRAKFLQAIPVAQASPPASANAGGTQPSRDATAGRPPALLSNPARVLVALDEGIARVGPVISLVEFAIAMELERQNYDGALVRITAAMERAPRRETWYVRQGDVLVKCGRTSEAIASYRAALDAIAELPERYRETVPIEKLARDARISIDQLSAQ